MVHRAFCCLVAAALLALQGCTSTVHYAVVTPRDSAANDGGCSRQCRLIHAAETKQYLACLRNCPNTRIIDDKQCSEVAVDANQYECSTAHAQKFDPTFGVIAIGFGVLLVIVLAATASPSQQ
jgi:hypothetical protein